MYIMVLGHVGQCVPELHRMVKEGKLSRECVGGETNPPAEPRGGSSSNAALGFGHLKWQCMGWLHSIEMKAPRRKTIVSLPKLRRSGELKLAVSLNNNFPVRKAILNLMQHLHKEGMGGRGGETLHHWVLHSNVANFEASPRAVKGPF